MADAVGQLRGHAVQDVEIRADCRVLRIALDDGHTLLVSVLIDEAGKPRLDVDFLRAVEEVDHRQLEVRFGEAE
jgi:hypothetical protein